MAQPKQEIVPKPEAPFEPKEVSDFSLLHELADGLRAGMSYLHAALRASQNEGSNPPIDPDLVEKAMEQFARAGKAYQPLYAFLIRAAEQQGE